MAAAIEEAADRRPTTKHRITIAEDGRSDSGFAAKLSFNGGLPFSIAVKNPFREKQERELEWYFEEWQRAPFTDAAKAEGAAGSIKDYGTQLFDQIFIHKKARKKYAHVKKKLASVEIEIMSQTPGFQAMHWEALWDPSLERPLAVECSVVRESQEPASQPVAVRASSVLNLLLVVARPDAEQDVGYRTISRPLVEAVAAGKSRVNIELLRPGTYKALSRKLSARGPGYYHIVHFDCHGSLMDYERVRQTLDDKLDARHGRKRLKRYRGTRAFLLLEHGADGGVDLVEASELAKLLVQHHIPICILNACQSGKQLQSNGPADGEQGSRPCTVPTSLGSVLAEAGLQLVLAMGYTVTISAAQTLMKAMYNHVFNQQPLMDALRLGRLELYCHKERKGYLGIEVNLEDWMLPIVYTSCTVDMRLQDIESHKKRQARCNKAQNQDLFAEPTFGFVGRDLEILKIEKMLLQHNGLLLQGMGGTGKTTLVTYLCDWWRMTHFVRKVFYFGYDRRPWTLQQILSEIAQQVYSKQAWRRFLTKSPEAQMAELVAKFEGEKHALVLDNLESVTAQELAIPNRLPATEQTKLQKFLRLLMEGQTKIVMSSRSGEEWLRNVFQKNVYHLQGLDHQSRSELGHKILQRVVCRKRRILEILQDHHYKRLMNVLAGYPLAMEVVLANLEGLSAGEILAGLEGSNIQLDAPSEDKTQSIVRCVEYSYRLLSNKTQHMLLCLAPFKSMVLQSTLHSFLEELQKRKSFKGFSTELLDGAVQDAANWGLLSISAQSDGVDGNVSTLRLQPVLPYFLNMKLNELHPAKCTAVFTAFKRTYQVQAAAFAELMLFKSANIQSIGAKCCEVELENLQSALEMCLAGQDRFADICWCLDQYFRLKNDCQRGLRLAKHVCKALSANAQQTMKDEHQMEMVMAQQQMGYWYKEVHDIQKAKHAYQDALALCKGIQGMEQNKKWRMGTTFHQLGLVAQMSGEFGEARQHHEQALKMFVELGSDDLQASVYSSLGNVAHGLRDFLAARQSYQQAFQMHKELGDHRGQAIEYHNLGALALEGGNYKESRCNFRKALEIHNEFGDGKGAAATLFQMGTADLQFNFLDRAKESFHMALAIGIEIGDLLVQANCCAHLGLVAHDLRDFNEARQNHQRALDMYLSLGNVHNQAVCLHNLGMVAEELRDFDEAHKKYQQSLDMKKELGDHHGQASTYHQLGSVAQTLRNFEEAKQHHQRALDIDAAIDDHCGQALSYHNLGVVAQEMGQYVEARQKFHQALEIQLKHSNRHAQAQEHFHLGVVSFLLGECSDAGERFQQALDICIEFDDVHNQGKVHHHLGMISEEMGKYDDAHRSYELALEMCTDSNDRHGEAKTSCALGLLEHSLGDSNSAKSWLLKGRKIFAEVNDTYMVEWAAREMLRIPDQTGKSRSGPWTV